MSVNLLWLRDTAERCVRTFVQAFLGMVLAGAFHVPGVVDLSIVRKAAVAGLALALSALMSAVGSLTGDPTNGSLLAGRGKHRRGKLDERVATSYEPSANVTFTALPALPRKALGRRPAKNAPALRFADHLTAVPDHPISELAPNLSWPMDHNDSVGCCVVAGLDHYRQVVYSSLGAPYTPWTDQQLLKLYQTQNPTFRSWQDGGTSRDQGMDVQTFLEYLVKQGAILGFAKVDHMNVEEMKAAIYLGLGVVTGEVLTRRNMTEQVWDYHPRDPQEGGHCTTSVGYTPAESIVSWGALYSVTDAFLQHNIEEAWFVITQAHVDHPAFRAGFDLASFAAAYQEITGATFPVPVTPAPVPTPVPAPTPAPSADVLAALDPVTLDRLTANASRRHETVTDDAVRIITSYFK